MRPPHLHLVATDQTRPSDRVETGARPRLGAVLQRQGLATADELQAGLEAQDQWDARLGEVLQIEAGFSEDDLVDALRDQWQTGPLDLLTETPDTDLLRKLGTQNCLRDGIVPWRRIGGATVIAAVCPDDYMARKDELDAIFGPTMLAIVPSTAIKECLSRQCAPQLNTRAEGRVPEDRSCRTWQHHSFLSLCLMTLAGLVTFGFAFTSLFVTFLTVLTLSLLALMTALKLAASLRLLRADPPPSGAEVIQLVPTAPDKLPKVSLLVPLFREQDIAKLLVERLCALKYPPALLDICLVVEHDDAVTQATLARTDLPQWFQIVCVPAGSVRTKPRALNYALDFCKGSIVGVYDAEDSPDPDQIDLVVQGFQTAPRDVACLQGKLAYYNRDYNFLARCFSIEYATWFGGMLPGIAKLGLVVPLGGTTLFFRREILEDIGAWDAHNVTEDADLGLRLARHGYRTELIDTTTWEEANCRTLPWIRQRSRWLKGYAMTYATHMRDPVKLWRDLSPRQFFGVQLMFGGTLLQALLAPLLWSWWPMILGVPHVVKAHLSHPMILTIGGAMLLAELLSWAVSIFALRRMQFKGLKRWVPWMNIYNMLATFAMYKAVFEMAVCPFYWDKTRHGVSNFTSPTDKLATRPSS